MIQGKILPTLHDEVCRLARTQKDMIAPSGQIEFVAYGSQSPALKIAGDDQLYPLTDTGHETLQKRLRIPGNYYERMKKDSPALLAYNVNTWLQQEQQEGISRMVRTQEGRARAFLSDKYERKDNYEFLNGVIPVLYELAENEGLHFKIGSAEITERNMYIQVIFSNIKHEFDVIKHGKKVGEVVHAGLVLKNSEVGLGYREIGFLAYTLACTNGMIVPKTVGSMVSRHIGVRKGNGNIFELSQETKEAEAHALNLAARDAIRQMADPETLQTLVDQMKAANTRPITGKVEEVVRVLSKTYNLEEDEQDTILKHLITDGDLSHYGLTNAITRSAQDCKSYDRAITLEEVGGVFLHMPERQLMPILAAKPEQKKKRSILALPE